MRRLLSVLFAVFYLGTASGVSVTAHYCGNSVSSVSFYEDATECSCPVKMKRKGCCSKTTEYVKLKGDHKASVFKSLQPDFTLVHRIFIPLVPLATASAAESCILNNSPPNPLHILYSVFRT